MSGVATFGAALGGFRYAGGLIEPAANIRDESANRSLSGGGIHGRLLFGAPHTLRPARKSSGMSSNLMTFYAWKLRLCALLAEVWARQRPGAAE